jgi:hypothetical protein
VLTLMTRLSAAQVFKLCVCSALKIWQADQEGEGAVCTRYINVIMRRLRQCSILGVLHLGCIWKGGSRGGWVAKGYAAVQTRHPLSVIVG